MPPTYDIDTRAGIVRILCGNTSVAEWQAVMKEILADARFVPGLAFLVDCRTATLAPSAREVERVVSFLSIHRTELGAGRWAVVVERAAGFGMANVASATASIARLELRAFRSVDEAIVWLLAGRRG